MKGSPVRVRASASGSVRLGGSLARRLARRRAHEGHTRITRLANHDLRGATLPAFEFLEHPNDSIVALRMALEALENQPEQVEVIGWL